MLRGSTGEVALLIILLVATALSGLVLYQRTLDTLEPVQQVLKPTECHGFHYKVDPTRVAVRYEVTLEYTYEGGDHDVRELGYRIGMVEALDCEQGLLKVYNGGVLPLARYPGIIPEELLQGLENESAVFVNGSIMWKAGSVSGEYGSDPYFGVYRMYDTLRYDKGTGLLLERVNVLTDLNESVPRGLLPDRQVIKMTADSVAVLGVDGSVYDMTRLTNNVILLSIASGALIGSVILALAYLAVKGLH